MYTCMCVYIYVGVVCRHDVWCVRGYASSMIIYMYIRVACRHVWLYRYIYIYMYVYIYVYIYTYKCVCIYTRMTRDKGGILSDVVFNLMPHMICNTLQLIVTHCNTVQYIATHCNTAQHTVIHGSAL